MSEAGRWVATWDLAESKRTPPVDSPGWRVAWLCDGVENVWSEMTFGRAEDANRAVKALYSLSTWQCANLEELRSAMFRITLKKIRQTILEAMAW